MLLAMFDTAIQNAELSNSKVRICPVFFALSWNMLCFLFCRNVESKIENEKFSYFLIWQKKTKTKINFD